MDTADGRFQGYDENIAHGMVAVIEYWSTYLRTKRRAHIYLPPGYMRGSTRYPVLYLLHGSGDTDESWTSNGHANYILDNLIARGRAKPMIVVMPFGKVPGAGEPAEQQPPSAFANDFLQQLIPYVDANFRTLPKPNERAMAGLSMGATQTLNIGLIHPELFAYIGIFSMGFQSTEQIVAFEASNAEALRRAAKTLRLVYYAMGQSDALYATVVPTLAVLDKFAIKYSFIETEGGHSWNNWRAYLYDFAPRLFR